MGNDELEDNDDLEIFMDEDGSIIRKEFIVVDGEVIGELKKMTKDGDVLQSWNWR